LVEIFAVFGGDNDVVGSESMLAGVLGRTGFALIGARAGAEECIGGVRGLACF
jgi:hypothetical protein